MAGGKRKEGQEHRRMPLGEGQQLPQRRWEHECPGASQKRQTPRPAWAWSTEWRSRRWKGTALAGVLSG